MAMIKAEISKEFVLKLLENGIIFEPKRDVFESLDKDYGKGEVLKLDA